METVCKSYNTRRKRKSSEPTLKSRVDWKRTKRDSISQILDSDESFSSEEEVEETGEESDDSSTNESEDRPDETTHPEEDGEEGLIRKPRLKSTSTMIGSDSSTNESEDRPDETTHPEEDGEEGRIRKPRLKNTSTMIGSDSSSDSDGPGEKVNVRRSCVIKDEDSDEAAAESSEDEETKAHVKKQKRTEALKQLAEKQRSRRRTISREATEESSHDAYSPLTPETPSESEDSDDMSGFIVQDEEENNNGGAETPSYKELFRKHHISLSSCHDLSSHLQKVIKAFLINIIDKKFLTSLYEGEREKRYAKDMLNSLNYLDNRIIGPRLEKLTTSCRWSTRYKERINCYPHLLVKHISAEQMSCKACGLYRYCAYLVTLSGKAYDNETLEYDDFLQDDKQILEIGRTCAGRTEAYHQLRHYKYFLYRRCVPFIEETKEDSANEIVDLALSKMEAKDFLGKEVLRLEGYLNEADYFQDESKDSLLS